MTDLQIVRRVLERLHTFGILAECTCDEPMINWNGDPCACCQIEAALDALDRVQGQRPGFAVDGLTPEQQRTLSTIQRLSDAYGYPPTLRELVEELGLSSTSVMNSRLETLERRGCIEREPGKPRTLRVVRWGPVSFRELVDRS